MWLQWGEQELGRCWGFVHVSATVSPCDLEQVIHTFCCCQSQESISYVSFLCSHPAWMHS